MDFEMYKMDAPVSGNDFGWGVHEHLTHHGNKTDLQQQKNLLNKEQSIRRAPVL